MTNEERYEQGIKLIAREFPNDAEIIFDALINNCEFEAAGIVVMLCKKTNINPSRLAKVVDLYLIPFMEHEKEEMKKFIGDQYESDRAEGIDDFNRNNN